MHPISILKRWSQNVTCILFARVTTGYHVRLDFPDGTQISLGATDRSLDVALRPPTLARLIRILLNPGLRTGESYVRGEWEVTLGDLVDLIKILQSPRREWLARSYQIISDWRGPVFYFRQRCFPKWNRRHLPGHYEAGNELYARMLDESWQYSCAFFSKSAFDNLDEAQRVKIDTSIERLRLTASKLRVLDIGSGWGGLAIKIASLEGEHLVEGITLSNEQLKHALKRCEELEPSVKRRIAFHLEDYDTFLARSEGKFDRVVSIGMFEHVGLGRHTHFFRSLEYSLCPGGRALIHSI